MLSSFSTTHTTHPRKLDSADLTLTCVDCSLHTNVSLGLHFDISINTLTNGTSCLVNANESCFSLNEAVMNLTVHDLNLTAALEVGMGKEVEVVANYT